MVAHACNPSTLGGQSRVCHLSSGLWDQPGQHGETLFLLKIQKISRAWWGIPVVPATQEAEAGELLEPRGQRLQWTEIMPLHSSLGDSEGKTPSPSKKALFSSKFMVVVLFQYEIFLQLTSALYSQSQESANLVFWYCYTMPFINKFAMGAGDNFKNSILWSRIIRHNYIIHINYPLFPQVRSH